MKRALALASLLAACGAATTAAPTAATEPEDVAPSVPPAVALTLGALTLQSADAAVRPREPRPPMHAELLDEEGQITGTRCGATSLSASGVLRREGEIVARLEARDTGGLALFDATGRDTQLVVREGRIESTSGELRFRRDGSSIVSPDPEVPAVEITPASANLDTALALFATLLVCNDLGP